MGETSFEIQYVSTVFENTNSLPPTLNQLTNTGTQSEDGYVDPIMTHEFQSHYFCPSRLLPAGASGIGNLGTVKKKRRKLVIKKSIVSTETEMPKRFKCFHCSRMFATTNGRASHVRGVRARSARII